MVEILPQALIDPTKPMERVLSVKAIFHQLPMWNRPYYLFQFGNHLRPSPPFFFAAAVERRDN
jgi:hypothetical protein